MCCQLFSHWSKRKTLHQDRQALVLFQASLLPWPPTLAQAQFLAQLFVKPLRRSWPRLTRNRWAHLPQQNPYWVPRAQHKPLVFFVEPYSISQTKTNWCSSSISSSTTPPPQSSSSTTTTTSSSTTTTTTTTSLAPVYTKFALEVANSPNTAANGRRLRTSIAPGTMIVSITGPPGSVHAMEHRNVLGRWLQPSEVQSSNRVYRNRGKRIVTRHSIQPDTHQFFATSLSTASRWSAGLHRVRKGLCSEPRLRSVHLSIRCCWVLLNQLQLLLCMPILIWLLLVFSEQD